MCYNARYGHHTHASLTFTFNVHMDIIIACLNHNSPPPHPTPFMHNHTLQMGRFTLRDEGTTIGIGKVLDLMTGL
jgi:translation elongation factor EF-1alpha